MFSKLWVLLFLIESFKYKTLRFNFSTRVCLINGNTVQVIHLLNYLTSLVSEEIRIKEYNPNSFMYSLFLLIFLMCLSRVLSFIFVKGFLSSTSICENITPFISLLSYSRTLHTSLALNQGLLLTSIKILTFLPLYVNTSLGL